MMFIWQLYTMTAPSLFLIPTKPISKAVINYAKIKRSICNGYFLIALIFHPIKNKGHILANTLLHSRFAINLPLWTVIVPILATLLLGLHFIMHPSGGLANIVTAVFLIGAVFGAVHHAEVIAHKVGEPFGTLVLALAVTVIEVALIVALMASSTPDDRAVLARDTVYAAVMVVNGILGACLLIGG